MPDRTEASSTGDRTCGVFTLEARQARQERAAALSGAHQGAVPRLTEVAEPTLRAGRRAVLPEIV